MILIPNASLEVVITLEIGLLTIFTLFFSFTGVKSYIQREFQEFEKGINGNNQRQKSDYLNSIFNKKKSQIMLRLDDLGRTFRTCIYLGLASLVVVLINEVINYILINIFLEILFLLFLSLQIWGLFRNVRRFKWIYSLDLNEELKAYNLKFDGFKQDLKEFVKEMNPEKFKKLNIFEETEESLMVSLKKDIKSLFKKY